MITIVITILAAAAVFGLGIFVGAHNAGTIQADLAAAKNDLAVNKARLQALEAKVGIK